MGHPRNQEPIASSSPRVDGSSLPAPSPRPTLSIELPPSGEGGSYSPLSSPARVWDPSVLPALSPKSPLPPSPGGGYRTRGSSVSPGWEGSTPSSLPPPLSSSDTSPSSSPLSSPLGSPIGSRRPSLDLSALGTPQPPSSPGLDPAAVPPPGSGYGPAALLMVGVCLVLVGVYYYCRAPQKPAPEAGGTPSPDSTPTPPSGTTPPPPAEPAQGEGGENPPGTPPDGASASAMEEVEALSASLVEPNYLNFLVPAGLIILCAILAGPGRPLIDTAVRCVGRPAPTSKDDVSFKALLQRLRR